MPEPIKMQRSDKLADVHPDMITAWERDGWTRCNAIAVAEPKQSDETQADEATLADLIDNRALEPLAGLGITTVEEFRAAANEDPDALIALSYVTANTIEKVG